MDIFNAVGKIRDRGIDVNNQSAAYDAAEDWESDQLGYQQAIFEITGQYIYTEFELQSRQMFMYVVAEIVRQNAVIDDASVDVMGAISVAQAQVERYFGVMTSKVPQGKSVKWRFASRDEMRSMVEEHKRNYVRPASKQDRAIEIIRTNPTAPTRELIRMFREQLGLTANGAATYVYNARKKLASEK